MKTTGIVRRVDNLGRIVIPKEICRTMNIADGTPMEIYISEDGITLKKHYQQWELADMLTALGEAIEDIKADLGAERSEEIRHNLRSIQLILLQDK